MKQTESLYTYNDKTTFIKFTGDDLSRQEMKGATMRLSSHELNFILLNRSPLFVELWRSTDEQI
ncbi:MAG TPA: hypothetical protein PLT31_03325 [Fibrobacteraceae bacterium]|jgi:hypothetical protein|nr:hypothetical protein [Fibrobacter sp.]HOG69194.1 hypothetical protein [Fibrobacteraceae bacterium]HPW94199.1 hypothetical protein [Fibrobacteraceae bacterium]